MPVYQYRCPSCTYVAEQVLPIDVGPQPLLCVECVAKQNKLIWMKRVWHATAVVFRGSGWASKS